MLQQCTRDVTAPAGSSSCAVSCTVEATAVAIGGVRWYLWDWWLPPCLPQVLCDLCWWVNTCKGHRKTHSVIKHRDSVDRGVHASCMHLEGPACTFQAGHKDLSAFLTHAGQIHLYWSVFICQGKVPTDAGPAYACVLHVCCVQFVQPVQPVQFCTACVLVRAVCILCSLRSLPGCHKRFMQFVQSVQFVQSAHCMCVCTVCSLCCLCSLCTLCTACVCV
jgi:hypothetical protein